jgi:hypothetical protein
MDRFVRRHNVEIYEKALLVEKDEEKRVLLLKLLDDERKKQKEFGDPQFLF